jgi:hypothetical protein
MDTSSGLFFYGHYFDSRFLSGRAAPSLADAINVVRGYNLDFVFIKPPPPAAAIATAFRRVLVV